MIRSTKPFLVASIAAVTLMFGGCSEASSADQTSAETLASAQDIAVQGNWDIVSDASHIRFTAEQEGEPFTGEFGEFSGVINFDPEAPENGSVQISIPLGSVDAGSKDRNSTLPAKVWFSAKAFPTATFTSDAISRDGDGYLAKGVLTLKGMTAPVDLPFTLAVDGDRAIMTGNVAIDRTNWNVGAAPWDTDEWVSRNVRLDLKVTADRR